jgi:hypothetical protein
MATVALKPFCRIRRPVGGILQSGRLVPCNLAWDMLYRCPICRYQSQSRSALDGMCPRLCHWVIVGVLGIDNSIGFIIPSFDSRQIENTF